MISEVAGGRCLPWVGGVGVADAVWTRGSGRLRLFTEQVASEAGVNLTGWSRSSYGDATVKEHNIYWIMLAIVYI